MSSQAHRLGVEVEEFGEIALASKKPANIAARCTVFAESDLVHKIQVGYAREDIVAGLCRAVATNYLNNVGKGKKIVAPVVFQGGVSKNRGVVKAFEDALGMEVLVDPDGHLMGAFGAALLAESERLAREAGATEMHLHAQCRVTPFYERMGYAQYGPVELDEHVEHIWMEKLLDETGGRG